MGRQIIRQPDGKLAVFSTGTDTWVRRDATPDELVEHYAERAAEVARASARREIAEVLAGQMRGYGYTFDEANENSRERGGEWWSDSGWAERV